MMSNLFHVLAVKGGWFSLLLLLGALPAAGSSVDSARAVLTWTQNQESSDTPPKKMSIKEYVEDASRMSGTWDNKRKTVQGLFDTAKKEKNVIRQNCVEPKLKDVLFGIEEGNTTVSVMTVSVMKEGQKNSVNIERMELLYQKVRVIDANIEEAVMEAGRCIGDEQFSSGEGLELKASHPDEIPFDPDSVPVILNDPLSRNNNYIPVNPDWSVEMTWPNASPYK